MGSVGIQSQRVAAKSPLGSSNQQEGTWVPLVSKIQMVCYPILFSREIHSTIKHLTGRWV